MRSKDYQATITAKVSAEEAIRRINQVSGWWTRGFKGTSSTPGDHFTVRFGETFVDFVIAELQPGTRVVWEVTDCNLHWITDKKEWKGTRVTWDLASKNGTTEIRMTHVGVHPGAECYDNCKQGWDFCVGKSLQKLLAEDVGLPDGDNASARRSA